MKKECVSCCALRLELETLREDSEERARADHDQCVAMFQQMQEMVKMNAALTRGCAPREGVDDSTCTRDVEVDKADIPECRGRDVDDTEQTHIRRLQAIVVQQAKEIETLRRRQQDTMRDSRVHSVAMASLGNQLEEEQESQSSDDEEDGRSATCSDYESARCVSRSREHANQLRKLPLTSLHARLKSKDLQLKHLQQVIAKLETRFGQIVDKKRSMAQSFQRTARTQQAHLKKYLAYIRQQTAEKKALGRQVRELNQYVTVLEKKAWRSSRISPEPIRRPILQLDPEHDGINLIQNMMDKTNLFIDNKLTVDEANNHPGQVHMTTRTSAAGNLHFRLKTLHRLHFGAASLRAQHCIASIHLAKARALKCRYLPCSPVVKLAKIKTYKDTFGVFVSGSDLLASFTGAYPLQGAPSSASLDGAAENTVGAWTSTHIVVSFCCASIVRPLLNLPRTSQGPDHRIPLAMSCISNASIATDDGKRRFPLRAIERFGIAEPDVSIKCCHAIGISGDMDQLLQFLPTAVMRTFNRHPRLRALVVQDKEFTAEIQPRITLDDVESKKLLRVREIGDSEEDLAAWKDWNHFVQTETQVPFDRFTQFMFYLTVWVNKAENKARFFLFSDHIMSDGDSGQIFINDTLEDVALLSIEAAKPVKEFPLRPSLYDMWFTSPWWLKPVAKTMVALVGGSAFVNFMKVFKPVLTPREDQKDFGIPFEQNSTTLLSHAGTPTNMRDTLRKCKDEGVTLGGALIPMLVLAFYHASKVNHKLKQVDETDGPFRFVADICYNMRQRVPEPAEERQVGLYVTNAPLLWLATEGVDMKSAKFWDLARTSKQQMAEQGDKLLEMAMPCFLMDRKLTKPNVGALLGDFKIPSSCTGDATISNLGRYIYKTKHNLAASGELKVEDMFAFCAIPFVATSSTIWLSTVNSFNYSLAHKVDEKVGSELFNAYVKICENANNIQKDDTMEDVLKRLAIEA